MDAQLRPTYIQSNEIPTSGLLIVLWVFVNEDELDSLPQPLNPPPTGRRLPSEFGGFGRCWRNFATTLNLGC
jgi:hypothetical protein